MVFQDMYGEVFLINDGVQNDIARVEIPGNDVLVLVNVDREVCVSYWHLFEGNFQVLLISSPKTRQDQKWLTQSVGSGNAVFLMKPWSQKFSLSWCSFISSSINLPSPTFYRLFISPIDITLKRLRDVTCICGYNPWECCIAAGSPQALEDTSLKIVNAIKATTDLPDAMHKVATNQPIHPAFEIWPLAPCLITDIEYPVSCNFRLVFLSDCHWADADAAYDFTEACMGPVIVPHLVERCSKLKFRSCSSPSLSLGALLYVLSTIHWQLLISNALLLSHTTLLELSHLTSSVMNGESFYLKPLSSVFPTFDSSPYQHEISQSGCQPFIVVQMITTAAHPISIKGLTRIKACLKPKFSELNNFQPTTATNLKSVILFMIPDPMMASFVKQNIKDVKKWALKTTQYILGLLVQEVMRLYVGIHFLFLLISTVFVHTWLLLFILMYTDNLNTGYTSTPGIAS